MNRELLNRTLDDLAPAQGEVPAWEDVLDLAGIEAAQRTQRPVWKRSWIIVVGTLIAVLVPLAAIGSEQDWRFFQFGGQSRLKPVTDVVVVKTGSWSGTAWELIAFRSDTEGLCFGLQPTHLGTPVNGAGGALSCGRIAGVPAGSDSKQSSMTITFLSGVLGGGNGDSFTAFAAGPVSDEAVQVDIYLQDGRVVPTPTFDAPEALGSSIRFYATQLPSSALRPNPAQGSGLPPLKKVVGLDGDGGIVACLTVPGGVTDLSACE